MTDLICYLQNNFDTLILTNDKILDDTKMKAFADNKIELT